MTEQFDSTVAEDAINAFLESKGYGFHTTYDSDTPGVLAFERIEDGSYGKSPLQWDELAASVVRATGYTMTCIADCDWSFDDSHDEEATWFAFETPGLTDDYRNDEYRNKISLTTPENAPSAEAFVERDKAQEFVKAHLTELNARLMHVKGDEKTAVQEQRDFLYMVSGDIDAGNAELVEALIRKDVAAAMEIASDDYTLASAPTP